MSTDPLDSPISKVCKDCRNVQWCIPTRQCLIARLNKSEAIRARDEAAAVEIVYWRPIETAPRDGTQMLLTNGEVVEQGWWEHQEPYIREQRDTDGNYIDQQEHDGFDGWFDVSGGMLPEATHWMPKPAPPKAQP